MAAGTFVQFDPSSGLILATVTGDSGRPPDHPNQIFVPSGVPVSALTSKVDVTQSPPALVAWTPPNPVTIARVDFYLRLTQPERTAIRTSTDPVVQDFVDLLSHADTVTLSDAHVQQGIAYLAAEGLLTQARATAILTP